MLEVKNVHAAYGKIRALQGVSLRVDAGEIVCLIGANGAGKTSLLNAASGLLAADEGEILNLAVAEEARGVGIGTALLEASLAWLAGRRVAKVYLEVRRSNAAAIAMYHRAGFATVSVRKDYYRMPAEDAVVMTFDLGAASARK